jgi:hypothetical protein
MAIIRPTTPIFVAEGQVCVYVTKFSEAQATGVFYLIGDSLIEPDFRGYESNIVIFNGTDYVIRERFPSVKISVGGETFEYVPASGWIQSRVYDTEDGGGSSGGSSLTAGDVQTAMTNALASRPQVEFSDLFLVDSNGVQFVRRSVWDENTGSQVESNLDLLGTPITVTPPFRYADTPVYLGDTVSNIQNYNNIPEDGVTTVTYDLNNPVDPSQGSWICFLSEGGTGSGHGMLYNVYPSSNTASFGTVTIYNSFGSVVTTDAVVTDGQQYWFKAANCGDTITIVMADTGGSLANFRISTHTEAPFDLAAIATQNASTAIVTSINELQQNRSFSPVTNAAIAAGVSTQQAATIITTPRTNQVELNVQAIPDGGNFYIEVRRTPSEQWRLLVWKNTNTGQVSANINYDGSYRANVNSIQPQPLQWRLTNIGSVTLPANLMTIEAITGIQNNQDIDSFTYSATLVTLAANTVSTFALPSSLHQRKPKSVGFSCKRPDNTTISDRTVMRFDYTTNMNKAAIAAAHQVRIIDFDYTNSVFGGNFAAGQISDNDAFLMPLTNVLIVKGAATTDVINNIFLEY